MNCLQIRQLVIIRVDAAAEEETSISAVDNLVASELYACQLVAPIVDMQDIPAGRKLMG